LGARRLKREFALTPSVGAIARILRQHGLTRRRQRKHQTKRDLRDVKARYAPLTHFQEANPRLPPEVLLLAPLDLDTLTLAAVGHDVPVLPDSAQITSSLEAGLGCG
jgi:hypothetical protein